MADFNCPINRRIRLHAQPLDDTNADAPIDGLPSWHSGDATVGYVTPQPDGSCFVNPSSAGSEGETVTITVSADADLGAGLSTITRDVTVAFVAAEVPRATHLSVTADPPEPQ